MVKRKKRPTGEGSLVLRKDGRWQTSFKPDGGKRMYFYAGNQKDALEKLHKAQHEERQGTLATGPQVRLADYLTQWLEMIQKPRLRKSTYNMYRNALEKHLIPALGSISLRHLKAQDVQSFYARKLDEGHANRTVRRYHMILHRALGHAVKWNLLTKNVCDLVSPPPSSRKREIQTLTPKQARQLLETVRGHKQLDTLLTVALVTGMRKGDYVG
jgi:integrase